MARIAVDAMGGDRAPEAVVEGAVLACRDLGVDVVLVGDENRIRGALIRLGAVTQKGLSIHHAPERIENDEAPAQAIRQKAGASLRVAFDLVRRGEADAVMSAGHTGAALAAALFVLQRLPSVERPAILAVLPSLSGPVVLLDAGANTEPRPLHLAQFARIGEVYARRVLGIAKPRIGVLANGEEASKGTPLTRAAVAALSRFDDFDFLGHVEGKDLFVGGVDVVATDGFTGNVVLKTAEGAVFAVRELLRRRSEATGAARLGAKLLRPTLEELGGLLDWNEVGGAPLLGCDGTVILAHGRSDAVAIRNAIRAASEAAAVDLREEISAVCASVASHVSDE